MRVTASDLHTAIDRAHEYAAADSDLTEALHIEVSRLSDVDARANDPHLRETDSQAEIVRKLMDLNTILMATNMALMEDNLALMRVMTGEGMS